jgi:hypothetical protein
MSDTVLSRLGTFVIFGKVDIRGDTLGASFDEAEATCEAHAGIHQVAKGEGPVAEVLEVGAKLG